MSTELKNVKVRNCTLGVTAFSGGTTDGVCVQLTPWGGQGYAQLTKAQAVELAQALLEFVTDTRDEV